MNQGESNMSQGESGITSSSQGEYGESKINYSSQVQIYIYFLNLIVSNF